MYFCKYCVQICAFLITFISHIRAFPDHGQRSKSNDAVSLAYFGMHKSLFAGSSIFLAVNCEPSNTTEKVQIKIDWVLRHTECLEDNIGPGVYNDPALKAYYQCPLKGSEFAVIRYARSKSLNTECSSRIQLEPQNLTFLSSTDFSQPPNLTYILSSDFYQSPMKTDCIQSFDSSTSMKMPLLKELQHDEKAISDIVDGVYSQGYPPHIKIKKRETSSNTDSVKLTNDNHVVSKTASERPHTTPITHETESMRSSTERMDYLTSDISRYNLKHGSKLAVADVDGIYLLVVKIESLDNHVVNLTVDITMKGDYGYLSAADFPLLIFYGVMCGIYAIYAFAWLFVSALQWRDLLRIQFWIGAVIFIGLVEKAVFYAEYQSINSTGHPVQKAVLFAELLSCMKRTIARMLVIIVSLGFGIVKPRLGPTLHRVICVGLVYFVFSSVEGCLRVLKPKNDPSNQALMAVLPLAIIDSAICWWIFSSLIKTIRTLRLRRNLVKLSLYRHFINTLVFAVLASVVYMVWSIHSHKLVICISDWKQLWIDEAYWHLLFSLVLLVIMILWRPTINNQRYAFTPLLDAIDDENEDDFEENIGNNSCGIKMRPVKNQSTVSPKQNDSKTKQDEDLKWVEENIPTSLTEVALPSLLDSDEEIMTAKFERSKME